MTYTPLSNEKHANLKRKRGTFFFLKDQPLVPVSIVEAPRAALDLPLVFTRTDKDRLTLMTILSLHKEENVHVGPKGLWMGGYMPAVIGACPFALFYHEDKATVVVGEDSDWLSTQEGKPLFDLEGKPTEFMDKIITLLKARFPNPDRDSPVLEAINKADILEPWSEVSENLLKVDLQRLSDMDDPGFMALRKKNALPVIYAQLMSMPRINRIKNLAKRKEKMSQKIQQTPDLIQDDDIISFD
jgi:hypothetical protein